MKTTDKEGIAVSPHDDDPMGRIFGDLFDTTVKNIATDLSKKDLKWISFENTKETVRVAMCKRLFNRTRNRSLRETIGLKNSIIETLSLPGSASRDVGIDEWMAWVEKCLHSTETDMFASFHEVDGVQLLMTMGRKDDQQWVIMFQLVYV